MNQIEIKREEELINMTNEELEEYSDSVYNYYDTIIAIINEREDLKNGCKIEMGNPIVR